MPIYIDTDTGFPSEVPCPGCGWPLYCCLCGMEDEPTTPLTNTAARVGARGDGEPETTA